jgi:acyl-CoA oxidase
LSADRLLLQFAPLIYVAWADGVLSEAELAPIQARLASLPSANAEVKQVVDRWLNPANPPSPTDLNHLLEEMRAAAPGKRKSKKRFSLAELGRQLARDQRDVASTPELQAVQDIEEALGLEGSHALDAILAGPTDRFALRQQTRFNVESLNRFIEGDRLPIRQHLYELLSAPECRVDAAAPTEEYRQRALDGCHWLAGHGIGLLSYPEEYGGKGSVAQSIAAFETIAFHDLSLLVKFGVQFGLFGGSVLQLGTRSHHDQYLNAIGRLKLPGCFAMTETAHGSNVRDIETTATYDAAADGFIINTPHAAARKDYIGNAAQHGRMATVFAQLEVEGERHGVHAFLVPIRDEHHRPLPGVRIEDCGYKAGLNGVDNGRLLFEGVRIPRGALLNRFADVSADGTYSSPIPSVARRFFTMLGTLVAGRISIACASCSVAKLALTIAVRYAADRRQFGPEGASDEVPILGYQTMQHGLLARLATTYALDAALHALVQRYAKVAYSESHASEDQREVEVLAASLKAYASRHALDTVQYCREACGGAGYLFENRFGSLREDVDIFTTFEGANPVLQQLAAKGLLTDYREQFGEMRVWGVMKFVTARATTAVAELNPITTRRTDPDHLRDAEFHSSAFRFREQHLLSTVARRLRSRLDDGLDPFEAMNECQEHLLSLADAQAERTVFDAFQAGIGDCDDPALKNMLTEISELYALHSFDRDRGWFLESGYMETVKTKAIRRELLARCAVLARDAVALVDAFGIPDTLVRAPIGTSNRTVSST